MRFRNPAKLICLSESGLNGDVFAAEWVAKTCLYFVSVGLGSSRGLGIFPLVEEADVLSRNCSDKSTPGTSLLVTKAVSTIVVILAASDVNIMPGLKRNGSLSSNMKWGWGGAKTFLVEVES
jgi:hypothetical protein